MDSDSSLMLDVSIAINWNQLRSAQGMGYYASLMHLAP